MAKKKKVVKRKINPGLKAWNDARSYISKQNKLLGNKFNGVELNALTKSAILDQYGQEFDVSQVETFLNDIPEFYYNILDCSLSDLSSTPFYMMDNKIQAEMPKGINIRINGGLFGSCRFNTFQYDYEESGLKAIVDAMREELYGKKATPSPVDNNEQFDGFLRLNEGAVKGSQNKEDYHIEWVLFIYDEWVTDVKGSVPPAPVEKRKVLPKEVFKKNRKKLSAKQKKEIASRVKSQNATVQEAKEVMKQNESLKKQLEAQQKQIEELQRQMAELMKKKSPAKKAKRKK